MEREKEKSSQNWMMTLYCHGNRGLVVDCAERAGSNWSFLTGTRRKKRRFTGKRFSFLFSSLQLYFPILNLPSPICLGWDALVFSWYHSAKYPVGYSRTMMLTRSVQFNDGTNTESPWIAELEAAETYRPCWAFSICLTKITCKHMMKPRNWKKPLCHSKIFLPKPIESRISIFASQCYTTFLFIYQYQLQSLLLWHSEIKTSPRYHSLERQRDFSLV